MPLLDAGFLLLAYAVTVLIETPVLLVGLSTPHKIWVRLFTGVWLSACTYPLLGFVFPILLNPSRSPLLYLVVVEALVVIMECLLFWIAFMAPIPRLQRSKWRDFSAIATANMASLGFGLWLWGIPSH